MNNDLWKMLTYAIDETIDTVRPRGDGGWVIVTKSLLIHATGLRSSRQGLLIHVTGLRGFRQETLIGRRVIAVEDGDGATNWVLLLDDGTTLSLDLIETIKRGLTPIEGMALVMITKLNN